MTPQRSAISRILDRFTIPEGLLLLTLAVLVGAATGLAAVVFIKLIVAIQNFSYGTIAASLPSLGMWLYLIVPILGGLLVGPLILFAHEAKGHGVPEVMQALVLRGGRIRARVAATKIVASALCIGTGGSAGREGPIIQVGSALGSSVGQVLRLSDERVRNLVACGAAAGIAANFNAPIAGVAFAIEVLMCSLHMRTFGNVVIAAVAASVVSRSFLGDRLAFQVPAYSMNNPLELFFYLLLGLAAALAGIAFIRMLSYAENLFEKANIPQLLKPAVGGLLLGLLGLIFMQLPGLTFPAGAASIGAGVSTPLPHLYGTGFPFIEEAIQGRTALWLLLLLIFVKPLATAFTLGSGNSGGIFAPSLFLGAMLGGAMGHLFMLWFPGLNISTGAFALVGMAAVFSATARSPLTAMLIVFEMSNDYEMILPLMAAGITASAFASWLHPESIYTLKLAERGVRFVEGRDMDIMQGVKISEVMRNHPVTIHRNASFAEGIALFQENNLLGFPVLSDDKKLCGIVTLQDFHRAQSKEGFNPRTVQVIDLAVTEPITVFPDEPIWAAIQKMSPRDLARLPVISRDGSGTLCGVISRSDILRAYDVGIVRKQRGQIAEHQVDLRKPQAYGYGELVLGPEDSCRKALVKDLALPNTITLVSIKRGGQTLIPHGMTRLAEGDVITVYGRRKEIDVIRDILNSGPLPAHLA